MLAPLARVLMIGGLLIFAVGVLLAVGNKFGLGHLLEDFTWQKGGTSIYFPVVTCIVISLILTILVNVALRLFR